MIHVYKQTNLVKIKNTAFYLSKKKDLRKPAKAEKYLKKDCEQICGAIEI